MNSELVTKYVVTYDAFYFGIRLTKLLNLLDILKRML